MNPYLMNFGLLGFPPQPPPPRVVYATNTAQLDRRGRPRRQPRPFRNHVRDTSDTSAVTNRHAMTTTYFSPATGLANHLPLPANQPLTPRTHTSTLVHPPQDYPLPPRPPSPQHRPQTVVWKSQNRKESEQYEKIRRRVNHVAAEMFKDNAKPFGQPAGIFPQTAAEYANFKHDMYGMRAEELEENIEKTKAIIEALEKIPKDKQEVKSAFGKDAKVFLDGMSPVLARETIWSVQHTQPNKSQRAVWPTRAELFWDGDDRENIRAGTRCGRFLPPPRAPVGRDVPFLEQPIIKPHRMDQTGPIFSDGPTPAEAYEANLEMNNDEAFEAEGRALIGDALMQEIGEYQEPFILDSSTEMGQLVEQFELEAKEYVFEG